MGLLEGCWRHSVSISVVALALAGATILSCLCIASAADEPVGSSIRYNREIVRIFERKCVACHGQNSLSVPLEGYHDVRTWARAIREEIFERRMPPWPAATGLRPLANDLSLTPREIATIVAWIDGGLARGDPADLPPPRARTPWPAGEPHLKLQLPPQTVLGDDRPLVRRITVPTGLPAERWLNGFDVMPGEPRALRSVFLFVKNRNGREQWLGGWTPWSAMTRAPNGVASHLPAQAMLVVELHYKTWTESGRPLGDRSTLGLYFESARPARTVQDLTISASPMKSVDGRIRLRGELTLQNDLMAWALRAKLETEGRLVPGSIELKAVKPDGSIEPLLWVKEHAPDWQLPYVLREPVRLPRGSRLVVASYAAQGMGMPTAVVGVAAYAAAPAASGAQALIVPLTPRVPAR